MTPYFQLSFSIQYLSRPRKRVLQALDSTLASQRRLLSRGICIQSMFEPTYHMTWLNFGTASASTAKHDPVSPSAVPLLSKILLGFYFYFIFSSKLLPTKTVVSQVPSV